MQMATIGLAGAEAIKIAMLRFRFSFCFAVRQ